MSFLMDLPTRQQEAMPTSIPPQVGLLPLTILRLLNHPIRYGRLVSRLMRDRRVPLRLKAFVIGAIVYVASPVDLVPEILIPLIGVADDAAILLLAVHTLIARAPREIVEEHALAISGLGSSPGKSG